MSQRGSFVTEYIDCKVCFEKIRKVLIGNEKYLCSTTVPAWLDHMAPLPIVAGKIGALGAKGEVFEIEQLIGNIEPGRCCDIKVVVIPEGSHPVTIVVKSDIATAEPVVKIVKRLTLKPEVEITKAMLAAAPNRITGAMAIVEYCKKRGYEISAEIAYKAWAGFSDGYCSVEWIIPKFNDQFIEALKSFCDVEIIELKD